MYSLYYSVAILDMSGEGMGRVLEREGLGDPDNSRVARGEISTSMTRSAQEHALGGT
jgi:hypothetical protein